MADILILGAGRSSSSLIQYLLNPALGHKVTVGDTVLEAAEARVGDAANGKAIAFDIQHESADSVIKAADLVISVLPASLHPLVAKKCLQWKKHLMTASYVSDEMKQFDAEAKKNSLLFLNECGLDPGIDHMSAMQVIDRIKKEGGELHSFESFTGGLIAPDTDPENPWRYKFTWNPRNVVMAGQGTAKFLDKGEYKYISYPQLFGRTTDVFVPGFGDFEGYANRDSLKYLETYGLQGIKTMLRGTLRNKGFCSAWDIFVQLGLTDDSYPMEDVAHMTHYDFINSFLEYHSDWTVEEKLLHRFRLKVAGPELQRLNWSGLFDNEPVGLDKGSPAQILEHILNKKWKLSPHDKDMIVMWHQFGYILEGKHRTIQATLVALGHDAMHTAMARTVGWPLAIAADLLLKGKIAARGVCIPTTQEFYEPILRELRRLGVALEEREAD